MTFEQWEGPGSALGLEVQEHSERSLAVYDADPRRVDEDAGQEEDLATGGYGRRQLFELVQNGVDAMIDQPGGRIEVRLTADALYCGNEGETLQASGVSALMHAHISPKRGSEIGRFGLGFKSVLGVTRHPRFYSRPASFVFDADRTAERIRDLVGEREQYPVLRLADLLDPSVDAASDPVLAEMMEWASTIVKLPLEEQAGWLSNDIDEFPPEFLLFSPHVGQLDLTNQIGGTSRTITLRGEDDVIYLGDTKTEHPWRVFASILNPTDEAKDQAGKLAARNELPVQWAVPLTGAVATGRFWAFFPLRDETTLSGIANAPWQVNDDRTGLLETSLLNEELLGTLTDLVVNSFGSLATKADPGRVLEILPGRGREARCWGDEIISNTVYAQLRGKACVPDFTGRLRSVQEIRVPRQHGIDLDRDLLERWGSASNVPDDWCHPSTIWSATRRSRVERLMEQENRKPRPIPEWLESMVDGPESLEASRQALELVGQLVRDDEGFDRFRSDIRRSRILLLANDELGPVDPSNIFLPSESELDADELRTVHAELATDLRTRPVLERLGFEPGRPEDELEAVLDRIRFHEQAADWRLVWERARRIDDPMSCVKILRDGLGDATPMRVQVVSGDWASINSVLLEGPIAKADRDPEVVVDRRFHSDDLEVIKALGVHQAPEAGFLISREPLGRGYLADCYTRYLAEAPLGKTRPDQSHMRFVETEITGPLGPIEKLSAEGCAALCESLLTSNSEFPEWTLRHTTEPKYPEFTVENPVLHMIVTKGQLTTTQGPRPVAQCLGSGFSLWSSLLPVVSRVGDREFELQIPANLDAIRTRPDADQLWNAICSELEGGIDDETVGSFYAAACRSNFDSPTDGIWSRIGNDHQFRGPSEVAVCDEVTFNELKNRGDAALLVPDPVDRQLLERAWGLESAETVVRKTPIAIESGTSERLADFFPLLRTDLAEKHLSDYDVVPCSELSWEFTTAEGTRTEDASFIVSDDEQQVFWLGANGPEGLLEELVERYDIDLAPVEVDKVVNQRHKQENVARLKKLRGLADDAERLVEAVGTDALRRELPKGLIGVVAELNGPVDDRRLAELVLAVHGYDTLQTLSPSLGDAGFTVPAQWAGTRTAREFVRELGFEDPYAGFPGASRDPKALVPGPSDLPDEHPYQRDIIGRLHGLLGGKSEHKRALLSLPTGAGKTRVMVQGLVEELEAGWLGSPVLWIAQSDELCEQAVQSWTEIWRRYGSADDLTISRLWGPNEADRAKGSQVVIATIDKLRPRVERSDYTWLESATCVVIDEAHSATTPEYTRVLEWLGISQRGRNTRTRCPLIGLTATPFRGASEDETKRLVTRFGKARLDAEVEDPYGELQKLDVLATVEGETLEGTDVTLSSDEVANFNKLRDVPKDVYRRIESDSDRNRRLLESIAMKPEDWPILLFAVSTDHAHTMAALLRVAGIPAASIDHNTNVNIRRRYIDEFRNGDLRVLCNYSVLTQGFDAPAVRAIYVSRPTFSPNVYQQMIGRGLRGPLNGGKERCLIVNVADNWNKFGSDLAFTKFEYLWRREDEPSETDAD